MQIFASTLNTRTVVAGGKTHIRSDVPTAVSEAEAVWLLAHGIRTVIDLRTEGERTRKPCPLQADPRFAYHTLPITGGDRIPPCPDAVAGSYIAMVDERFFEVLSLLQSAPGGVLYFCNAGKDRTGVVTAALLHSSGTPHAEIVSDYMRSRDALSAVLAAYAEKTPGVDINVITPQERYIEEFLAFFAARDAVHPTNGENV